MSFHTNIKLVNGNLKAERIDLTEGSVRDLPDSEVQIALESFRRGRSPRAGSANFHRANNTLFIGDCTIEESALEKWTEARQSLRAANDDVELVG